MLERWTSAFPTRANCCIDIFYKYKERIGYLLPCFLNRDSPLYSLRKFDEMCFRLACKMSECHLLVVEREC